MKRAKYIIGIDEAGRGPLAGPVAVGVILVSKNFNWKQLPRVGDSKQVSPKHRLEIFALAKELKNAGLLDYEVVLVSAKQIDAKGIVPAIKSALKKGVEKVLARNMDVAAKTLLVKLDGGLKAPEEFLYQETIIKGDSKELSIGLASIMAKVTRDHYMERLGRKPEFSKYGFAIHKGYGTKMHRGSIAEFGPSKEHRLSFCKNILKK